MASTEGIALVPERAAAPARPARDSFDVIKGGLAAWLPALPLLALAAVMLVVPTIALILGSFGLPGQATLDYWIDTLESNGGRGAILTSVRLGLVSALVALLVGSPLSTSHPRSP